MIYTIARYIIKTHIYNNHNLDSKRKKNSIKYNDSQRKSLQVFKSKRKGHFKNSNFGLDNDIY